MIYLIFTLFILFTGLLQADSIELETASRDSAGIHGVVDIEFKNDYITTRGLLVTNTGLTVQVLTGLSLDLYKNQDCWIQNAVLNFGIWNDLWTDQDNPYVGAWKELDWYVGTTINFRGGWKLQAQFIEFVSPPHAFRPANNAEFVLSYDDSACGLPITINPYIKLFWEVSGDSTVVVGRNGNTYYFEFGMIPRYEINEIVFTMPTWFSVGPESFWNGGDLALKSVHDHFGLFSTGLRARIPLGFIPAEVGKWYIDVGAQYYYLINDNLLQAQVFTLQLNSYKSAHRNVGVGFVGVGFEF
jgi:hypothetical protein